MRVPSLLCSRLNRLCYHCSVAIPLGVVYFLVTWAWVVFAGTICLYSIGGPLGYLLAIISTVLYGMVVWCYSCACFIAPGSPASHAADPSDVRYSVLPQHDIHQPSFTSVTVKDDGTERYCQKCSCKKPDRTHHCRSCGRCVLKMDHHCPWLATCVGYYNQKSFILFCIYLPVWCLLMCSTCVIFLWDFFTVNVPAEVESQFLPINWIILSVLSGTVAVVLSIFGAWHVSLVLRNYTTIEHMEETRFKGDQRRYLMAASVEDKFNIFDLNYKENWSQVFGQSKLFWFLPIRGDLDGDGYNFKISDQAQERLREQHALHDFEQRDRPGLGRYNQHYELYEYDEDHA